MNEYDVQGSCTGFGIAGVGGMGQCGSKYLNL